ncbi:hypothetical protein GT646_01075 [Clostridium butyricum]|uniref:hypothetical protein n=1 Tax=Clostridium butyricum TaxID=1492 RepID=UPI00136FF25C|nr:hypothetical protein [Clostridium butyricum]MZI79426.1 hypothetical protein [Clostridium butyricum]
MKMDMYQREKLNTLNLTPAVLENSVQGICEVLKKYNLSINQSDYVLNEVRKTLNNKPLWFDSLK